MKDPFVELTEECCEKLVRLTAQVRAGTVPLDKLREVCRAGRQVLQDLRRMKHLAAPMYMQNERAAAKRLRAALSAAEAVLAE